MTIYTLTLSGKTLLSDRIILNKLENKVSSLHLNTDESVFGNFYMAFKHEDAQTYFYLPFDDNMNLLLDTRISYRPGKWTMILIITESDYILEGDITELDQNKITFVSNSLPRLIVQDNYLDDELDESEIPSSVKIVLDDLLNAKSSLIQIRDETASIVAGFSDVIESGKEEINEYVDEKKDELKGDTGNVYFASFKVVDGRLKMYSDPTMDKVTFSRDGSRLKYRLNI